MHSYLVFCIQPDIRIKDHFSYLSYSYFLFQFLYLFSFLFLFLNLVKKEQYDIMSEFKMVDSKIFFSFFFFIFFIFYFGNLGLGLK